MPKPGFYGNLVPMNTLTATKRSKTELLATVRTNGMVPAVVYGAGIENTVVSVPAADFKKVFAQVAKQQKVAFVPFFLEGVGGNNQLMQADNIHPNAQAQDKLVQNVWVQLQGLL